MCGKIMDFNRGGDYFQDTCLVWHKVQASSLSDNLFFEGID